VTRKEYHIQILTIVVALAGPRCARGEISVFFQSERSDASSVLLKKTERNETYQTHASFGWRRSHLSLSKAVPKDL